MAKKPSFFEKLTGASWSEDAPKQSKKLTKKKLKAKKSKIMSKDPEEVMPVSSKPSKKEAAKESKDWLSESEGQLTIDVYQTPNEVVIKSTIAGVNPGDIDITMSNDMITIKGNRQKDEQIREENYYYQECYWGPFSRSIILPVDVEVDQAEATMKNGILTVKLPKVEKVKTKKIAIKAE